MHVPLEEKYGICGDRIPKVDIGYEAADGLPKTGLVVGFRFVGRRLLFDLLPPDGAEALAALDLSRCEFGSHLD